MPIPQELLKRLDEDLDRRLKNTDPKQFSEGAPQQAPCSDGAPQKIHGQPDQDFWNRPPKPPIPIDHL